MRDVLYLGQQVLFNSKICLEIDAFKSHSHTLESNVFYTLSGVSQNKNNAYVGRDMRVFDDDLATGSNGSNDSIYSTVVVVGEWGTVQ